jgi:hypothetical protein
MNPQLQSILFSFLVLTTFLVPLKGQTKDKNLKETAPKKSEISIPVQSPIFVVVKGMFPSRDQAESTRSFIQQLLVKTPADGIIESEKLSGFPPKKWIIASAFDSEKKAEWWMHFSDRNNKLPRSYLKKTELLEESPAIPYFPEATRDGVQRFYTEEEVIERIQQFSDIQNLSKKTPIKFSFLSYPRTGNYTYEVEVMEDKGNRRTMAYDFITMSAVNLNRYSRYLENLGKKK